MLDSVERAIEEIKQGRMVIIVDDENRENEGDFVAAAENISYENINKMVTLGRGLMCVPLSEDRADKLGLHPMAAKNTDAHGTAFTISVDAREGITTGISVGDRLKTIRDLANDEKEPSDFRRPGHLFPLLANNKGVLERPGHTEAAVDLARLAGFAPVGVICEILKEDGTMARLPDLKELAAKENCAIISIQDLIRYRKDTGVSTHFEAGAKLPIAIGDFDIRVYYSDEDKREHVFLSKGDVSGKEGVLVRVHSECLTGDVFGSQRCDCGEQLQQALKQIEERGEGIVLYLRQEGRGIGLGNKMKAYALQEQGYDTVEANHQLGFGDDLRDYRVGAEMLQDAGVKSIDLLTNNPSKQESLEDYGITIRKLVQLEIVANPHNTQYLQTKKEKMRHNLKLQ